MTERNVSVALAGVCGYGDSYLKALLDAPADDRFDLVGVVEPHPEHCKRLGDLERRRVPVFGSLEAFYDARGRADLVILVTPIHLHAPQTCLALSNGSSVLCEKPVGATVEDGLRMLAAEEAVAGGAFAAIGFQWSFSRAIQNLKRDVLAGDLGRPVRLKTIVSFPRPEEYFHRNDWAGRLRTPDGTPVFDGPVNNAASHYLHNMLFVLGPAAHDAATPATVQAELYRANDIPSYDTACLRCRTDGGAELLFYATHAVPLPMGPVVRFEFERAVVTYEAETRAGFVARFRDGSVRRYGDPNVDRPLKIWQSIDAARHRHGRDAIACHVRTALPHALCVAAAHRSTPEIRDFPDALVNVQPFAGHPMRAMESLASALVQCYDLGVLPSEHGGLTWAAPGRTVSTASVLRKAQAALTPEAEDGTPAGAAHGNGNGNGHAHATTLEAAPSLAPGHAPQAART